MTPVTSIDWAPTFLSLAGIKARRPFEGVDLVDLLKQQKPLAARPLFWHYPSYTETGGRPAGAIRVGAWKLVEQYESGACELYNLEKDVAESVDLAAKEPALVADLRGKLEAWRRSMDVDPLQANPDFNSKSYKTIFTDIDISRLPPEKNAVEVWKRLGPWARAMRELKSSLGFGTAFDFRPVRNPSPEHPPGAGAIILHAKDAQVHGDKLRYEPQPQKDTLGFWVNKDDWLEWKFTPPHSGVFDVEVLQGCGKGSGGAEVAFEVAGQSLTMKVEETGHFQRFVPRVIGQVKLDAEKASTLTVRARTKPG